MLTDAERVRLTTSCRDADPIPKVPDAGAVRDTPAGPVQVMHNGVLVVEGCYYGDWMTQIIRQLRGHHEPQEERVFHEIVERLAGDTERPTVVELGAFWAYYSLWALHRIPGVRAILVEPDPHNLDVARANLELNGRRGDLVQASVGAEPAPPSPFLCESDGAIRPIAKVSIASLLEQFDVARIDVLLADVQGAELDLLRGARELLGDRVRFLVLSTHHHLISGDPLTHQRCLGLLREAGAHVIAEHTVAESYSGDGLIAASFDPRDAGLVVSLSSARAGASLFGDPLEDLAVEQAGRRDADARLQVLAADLALERQAAVSSAARSAAAEAEVAAMAATTMWRLHRRLEASRLGQAALRTGGRVARSVSSVAGSLGRR
jgi:FkbM family methyltransferase